MADHEKFSHEGFSARSFTGWEMRLDVGVGGLAFAGGGPGVPRDQNDGRPRTGGSGGTAQSRPPAVVGVAEQSSRNGEIWRAGFGDETETLRTSRVGPASFR